MGDWRQTQPLKSPPTILMLFLAPRETQLRSLQPKLDSFAFRNNTNLFSCLNKVICRVLLWEQHVSSSWMEQSLGWMGWLLGCCCPLHPEVPHCRLHCEHPFSTPFCALCDLLIADQYSSHISHVSSQPRGLRTLLAAEQEAPGTWVLTTVLLCLANVGNPFLLVSKAVLVLICPSEMWQGMPG